MRIRAAKENEIDEIMEIYAAARQYMAKTGNAGQWGKTYPPKDLIADDIRKQQCFVGECEDGGIHFVFALITGGDAAYRVIYDGNWLNEEEYLTVHRVASDGKYHGMLRHCLNFCRERGSNIRIDTHRDNFTMQHVLEKNGFIRCGTIYLENGEERIAYQFAGERGKG